MPLSRAALPALLLPALMTSPAPAQTSTSAQPPAPPPLMQAIFLGGGQVLHAAPTRQLSLNAHVEQYAYQPGGLEIAYSGTQTGDDPDQRTAFVKLAGVRRGETATLLTQTVSASQQAARLGLTVEAFRSLDASMGNGGVVGTTFSLDGWSSDGRYLLTDHLEYFSTPNHPGQVGSMTQYSLVDVGASPPRVVPITLPTPPDKEVAFGQVSAWWSPAHDKILLEQDLTAGSLEKSDRESIITGYVYEPGSGRLLSFPVADDSHLPFYLTNIRGWLDETHVLLGHLNEAEKRTVYRSHDLVTGQETEIPKPRKMPINDDGSSPVSPKNPAYTIDKQAHQIVDGQHVSSVDSYALWVRRTKGPEALSAVPIGVTPGNADPKPQWSPTGTQVAYLAHGDLFVTDLVTQDASPREKLVAGEALSCAEERQLATSSLKQIGLSILQYCQDNDETYPSSDGVQDKVLPYLKDASLFTLGKAHFVYHAPANLALAKMENPADTVLGTYDVPCAKIVLYADGHVKQFPTDGGQP